MIAYISNDDTDHTVIFSTDGTRWEYWLTPAQCHTVDYLAHKISTGKAFAYAKSHAHRTERLTNA